MPLQLQWPYKSCPYSSLVEIVVVVTDRSTLTDCMGPRHSEACIRASPCTRHLQGQGVYNKGCNQRVALACFGRLCRLCKGLVESVMVTHRPQSSSFLGFIIRIL